jgi:capsular exopolysaccharide synthesis family protein
MAMAQMGRKTLLVEADLRKPFLHVAFGVHREPGLAEAILGNQPWTSVVRTVTDLMLGRLGLDQIVNAPNIDKLSLITSGTLPANPAEFLNSQRMTELIAAFKEQYDIVIFDCAPVLPVTDAAILGSKTDGVLLVHRVGTIARAALRRSKTLLENVHGRVLGIVLTGLKAEISPDFEALEYERYRYGDGGEAKTARPAAGAQGARRDRIRSLFSSRIVLAVAGAGALAGAGAPLVSELPPAPPCGPDAPAQHLQVADASSQSVAR